jgi:hypothetical protein
LNNTIQYFKIFFTNTFLYRYIVCIMLIYIKLDKYAIQYCIIIDENGSFNDRLHLLYLYLIILYRIYTWYLPFIFSPIVFVDINFLGEYCSVRAILKCLTTVMCYQYTYLPTILYNNIYARCNGAHAYTICTYGFSIIIIPETNYAVRYILN